MSAGSSLPTPAHQRRAAWSALEPVLGRERAEQALPRLLGASPNQRRLAGVSDVISFVDAVVAAETLDDATRRTLYATLHAALQADEASLPAAPWPAQQDVLGAAQAPNGTEPTSAHRLADAPQAVFAALLAAVAETVQTHHAAHWIALRQAALMQIDRARVSVLAREGARAAWHHATDRRSWQVGGQPTDLRELVHRTYLALCEALGPVIADEVLTLAARHARQIPEAQTYSPGHLL